MRESIHKYFQIGTIQWMSHPAYPVGDSIRRLVCDDYFDALEVTAFKDAAARDEAKELFAQSRMRVCFGAQPCLLGPGLNPNDLDEGGRVKALDALLAALDEAEYLGARGIAFLAGKWEPAHRDEAYAQLLKTTRALCDAAAKKDMLVELEVFDYDVDKAALIGPAPYAAQFAADVRATNDNFGLLIDLSHFPLTYENSEKVVTACAPYVTHLHIGNAVVKKGCEGYGDLHPRFGFPNSANDLGELVDFLRVVRREGLFRPEQPLVLSFEVKPYKDEDADAVLAGCKRILNRAWALLEEE